MSTFRKREDCPHSETLLEYQAGTIEDQAARAIGAHLSACEFCSAEALFYELYPLQDDDTEEPLNEPCAMPEPLFELALAILNHRITPPSMARLRAEIDAISHEGNKTAE